MENLTSNLNSQTSWGNEQAEATSKSILDILKKKFSLVKKTWVNKLFEVLQALITTKKIPTRETLFSLVYGIKAMTST